MDKCPHCGEAMCEGAHPDGNPWCDQHYEDAETGRLLRLLYQRGYYLESAWQCQAPHLVWKSVWPPDDNAEPISRGGTVLEALREAATKIGIETGGATDEQVQA